MTDNTNADVETRKHWINLAHEYNIPIRCVRFTASSRLAEHNAAVRALNPDTVCVYFSCLGIQQHLLRATRVRPFWQALYSLNA